LVAKLCTGSGNPNPSPPMVYHAGYGALRHRWRALPASITQGTWCPACARTNASSCRSFSSLQRAEGEAVWHSINVNQRTSPTWRCAAGHQWNATPAKMRRVGRARLAIQIGHSISRAWHPSRVFAYTMCLAQSPRQVSNLRAVSIQEWSSGTDFRLPATLCSGTGFVLSPRAATISPNFPS